jgi:hypothetical protein
MNVYEKLQNCRCELQRMNIKKTGQNKYAGYEYYELGDFLPHINDLMLKYKLCSYIIFDAGIAQLVILNVEKPDENIIYTTPTAEANLKGCHPVQNLGAVQTYLRRYLYTNAFEIVEHDALDTTMGKETQKGLISQAQIKRLYALASGHNDIAKEILAKKKYASAKDIKADDYDNICKLIQAEIAIKKAENDRPLFDGEVTE